MSIVPARIEGAPIPQTISLRRVALASLVQWLSNIVCNDIKRYVDTCINASSYGAINQEFDLEVLRIIESRLDEIIEDLAAELKETP